MNKQNKKIAQEKRRIEREKAEKKAKVVNLLKFWVPVVAVVVVVIVLIWAVATSGGSSSKGTAGTQAASQTTESQASETQSSDSQTKAATLNTETDTVAEFIIYTSQEYVRRCNQQYSLSCRSACQPFYRYAHDYRIRDR